MTERKPRLSSNLALLYAGELGSKILAFFVFRHLAVVLGADTYGDLEFALGMVFVVLLILEAGLGPFAAQEATRNPERLPRLAATVVWIRLLLLLPALSLLVVQALLLGGGAKVELLALTSLNLLAAPFVMNWAFQARDEMGVLAFTAFLRQAVQAVFVFALVRTPADARWAPLGDFVGWLLILAIQWVALRRRVGRIPFREAITDLGPVFRASFPLAVSAVFSVLRWFIPLLSLGWFSTSHEVAQFGIGHRLVYAAHTFVWLWFFNLLPTLSRAAATPENGAWKAVLSKSFVIAFWLGSLGTVAGVLAAPSVLPAIYGNGYTESVLPFQLLLLGLFVAFLSGHHRFALIAFRRPTDDLRANALGAIVGGVFAIYAASVGSSASFAAMALVLGEVTTLVAAVLLLRARAGLFTHSVIWRAKN